MKTITIRDITGLSAGVTVWGDPDGRYVVRLVDAYYCELVAVTPTGRPKKGKQARDVVFLRELWPAYLDHLECVDMHCVWAARNLSAWTWALDRVREFRGDWTGCAFKGYVPSRMAWQLERGLEASPWLRSHVGMTLEAEAGWKRGVQLYRAGSLSYQGQAMPSWETALAESSKVENWERMEAKRWFDVSDPGSWVEDATDGSETDEDCEVTA